jgi:hypothetical protein
VLGLKKDLRDDLPAAICVPVQKAEKLAKKLNGLYKEVSAKESDYKPFVSVLLHACKQS